MTLSRKKSRPIIIDEENYRWAIAPDSGYVTLVVEKTGVKGQKIAVQILTDINDFWTEFPDVKNLKLDIVTPKLVRHCIIEALKKNWSPDKPGKQMDFNLLEDYILKRIR